MMMSNDEKCTVDFIVEFLHIAANAGDLDGRTIINVIITQTNETEKSHIFFRFSLFLFTLC